MSTVFLFLFEKDDPNDPKDPLEENMKHLQNTLAFGALIHLLNSCTIATPFRGNDRGGDHCQSAETVIVGLTHATLGEDSSKNEKFREHTRKVADIVQSLEGNLGYSLRRQIFGKEAWTISLWKDEDSLQEFMRHPVHREAMKEGGPAMARARFATVEISCSELPISWDRALELIDEHGREGRKP